MRLGLAMKHQHAVIQKRAVNRGEIGGGHLFCKVNTAHFRAQRVRKSYDVHGGFVSLVSSCLRIATVASHTPPVKRERPVALHRRRLVIPTQHQQRPRRELNIRVEVNVRAGRVRIAEHALQRVRVVDAVRAGELMQAAHRLDA